MDSSLRLAARLCWAIHARQKVLIWFDIAGALLFVIGCLVFYSPAHYQMGVTMFLLGSVLMLVSIAGRALAQYGPSQ